MLNLTAEEKNELEQLLIDIVYNNGHIENDYNLAILFEVLTKVENANVQNR